VTTTPVADDVGEESSPIAPTPFGRVSMPGRPHGRQSFGQRMQGLLLGKRAVRDLDHPFVTSPAGSGSSQLETFKHSTQNAVERSKAAVKAYEPETPDSKLIHVALVLSLTGLSLVVFLAYAFVFTGLQEKRTQHVLLEQFDSANLKLKNSLLTGVNLKEGQPEALLQIPAIGVNQVVVKGTSSTDLMEGPGLMPDTALPGTKGNSVIAGRRSTAGAPFASLPSLHRGDKIVVVTGLGKFTYEVSAVGTAVPGGADPISPTSQPRLTLVTSDPPVLATGRVYVEARLTSPAAIAPLPNHAPAISQRGLSGDPTAVLPTIIWGILFTASLFVTVAFYRRWKDQVGAVYLLSTPIVLTIALLFFENLYRLLPATL
jgi:sortase A